jgi:hypothetical protein
MTRAIEGLRSSREPSLSADAATSGSDHGSAGGTTRARERLLADLEEVARFFEFTACRVGGPGSPVRRDAAEKAVTVRTTLRALGAPVDMVLHCPVCHAQHVDEAESECAACQGIGLRSYPENGGLDMACEPCGATGRWLNPPHRSHLCHVCGCIWRPADVATNGVAEIATRGGADTHPLARVDANHLSEPVSVVAAETPDRNSREAK